MTSRSSQADDVREFADVQAEITGFNTEDIKQYLAKQLGKADAEDLFKHLEKQRLIDTAKVPLLALFFSILWKKEKASFIDKTRTVVFSEIVRCIWTMVTESVLPANTEPLRKARTSLLSWEGLL
ncbi:NLR, CARD [Desmophyllum pertusum]|uniref:NLR, CARD n=1 Tax=Desmophyllum pertusum TaxID=174260 RepID=A0A9W9YTH1_9CNID|nr:NLR, CARD [Desmophyllum pertusum]